MGQTPVFQLPWPELVDRPQGPDGFKNLAQKIDAVMLDQRDGGSDTKTYTPTWSSKGSQPSGMVFTARYVVREGWCTVAIFGNMPANVNGGTWDLVISLPVKSRAGFGYQCLGSKLTLGNIGNYQGFAQIWPGAQDCVPFFTSGDNDCEQRSWRSADGSGVAGTGIPRIPGKYSVAVGNVVIWGTYLT